MCSNATSSHLVITHGESEPTNRQDLPREHVGMIPEACRLVQKESKKSVKPCQGKLFSTTWLPLNKSYKCKTTGKVMQLRWGSLLHLQLPKNWLPSSF